MDSELKLSIASDEETDMSPAHLRRDSGVFVPAMASIETGVSNPSAPSSTVGPVPLTTGSSGSATASPIPGALPSDSVSERRSSSSGITRAPSFKKGASHLGFFAAHRRRSLLDLESALSKLAMSGVSSGEEEKFSRVISSPLPVPSEKKESAEPKINPLQILCRCQRGSENGKALALLKAASIGRLDIVRILVEEEGLDPNCISTLEDHIHQPNCADDESGTHLARKKMQPGPGWPAICAASCKGYADIVEYLLEKGATPDATTIQSETRTSVSYFPLYLACSRGYKDIVKMLLHFRSQFNINQVQQQGYNVVIGSCMLGNDDPEILKLVLEAGANVNHLDPKGGSAMFLCAQHGRPEFMRILLKYGADPAPRPSPGHSQARKRNSEPLHIAASRNHASAIKVLLEHGAEVNSRISSSGATCLHLAAFSGFLESAKALLEFDADIDAVDLDGMTPLHKACDQGHLAMVMLLLENFAQIDCKDSEGQTPLMISLGKGHAAVAKALLLAGALPNLVSNAGVNVFEYLLDGINQKHISEGVLELCSLLIKHGANVDLLNPNESTPLHLWCKVPLEMAKPLIEMFLDNGASIEAQDKFGRTPLHIAVACGRPDLVALFLARGANPFAKDSVGNTLMVQLALHNREVTESFPDINLVAVAEMLIRSGVDLNESNDEGMTPLAGAIQRNHASLIRFFLSYESCDPCTMYSTSASRSVVLGMVHSTETQTAVAQGMSDRAKLSFLRGFSSSSGKGSLPMTKMVRSSIYDTKLLNEMMKFM